MSELNKPATPVRCLNEHPGPLGITIRQHAAITLRVPMSGDPELDAMIREARRLDMATAAMQSLVAKRPFEAHGTVSIEKAMEVIKASCIGAFDQASAMLAASEPKKADPECLCDLRTKLVGDGCEVCNPDRAKDLSGSKCECEGYGLCARCLSDDADPPPAAEGWIEWNSGKCPVEDQASVEAMMRNGQCFKQKAYEWDWAHNGNAGDIIAYRIVKE